MTDYAELVKRLRDPFDMPRDMVTMAEAANAIEELEADLAAARAALRGASTIIMRPSWYESHDTAIAAARVEKEKTDD